MAATLLSYAKRYGREAGHNAASWVFDGNTDVRTYDRILTGIDEGDPAILDSLPVPDLSGEWADSPTPHSLAESLGISDDDSRLPDLCSAWEEAAGRVFFADVESAARYQLGMTRHAPSHRH